MPTHPSNGSAQAVNHSNSAPTQPKNGRVLVVDDERVNRAILARFLKTKGYEAVEAEDGATALGIIADTKIDLVLLDIAMPGMSGFEVLTTIRESRSESELPTIMVTADDDRKQIIRAFREGANDYITKPIDTELAFARIGTQMKLKRAQDALQLSEERYALSALGSNDGLWDWQITEDDVYYSPRWKSMQGLDENAEIDSISFWLDRIHQEDRQRVEQELDAHLKGEIPHFEIQLRLQHEDGGYRWMLCRGMAVRDQSGTATRIAGSLSDITEGKVADALTGLPNRQLFRDCLQRTIERNERQKQASFAVLFIDLDKFKLVNDTLGHQAGDQLLMAVARRLEGSVRSHEAIVSRLGGDEFTILLEMVDSRETAEIIAKRIIDSFSEPFSIGDHREVFCSASIGVNYGSKETLDVDNLMRGADAAMYQAKKEGRAGVRFFEHEMLEKQQAETENGQPLIAT